VIARLYTIAALQLRQLLGGTRLLVLGVLLAGLVILPGVVRVFAPPADAPAAVYPLVFVMMLNFVFLQTVVILVPLLLATSLIRDEVEEGTLVYLVTRPLPRPVLLLGKYAAITLVAAGLVAVGMTLFELAFLLPGGDPTDGEFGWGQLLVDFILAGLLGVLAYGAVFTLLGLVFKRGLIWGLVYGFVSELVLTNVPAVVREVTIMFYVRSIALSHFELRRLGLDMRADEMDEVKEVFGFFELASPGSSALTLLAITAVALALSAALMWRREFAASPTRED
jgi:ABC-2 type transport system permease protein